MYVPIMLILDDYYDATDEQYEVNKFEKRKCLIKYAVLISLFWGAAPLFGWSRMDFEPTGLSCSIYENKPGFGYFSYLIVNVTFYEIGPLCLVMYCIIKTKNELKSLNRVLKLIFYKIYFTA